MEPGSRLPPELGRRQQTGAAPSFFGFARQPRELPGPPRKLRCVRRGLHHGLREGDHKTRGSHHGTREGAHKTSGLHHGIREGQHKLREGNDATGGFHEAIRELRLAIRERNDATGGLRYAIRGGNDYQPARGMMPFAGFVCHLAKAGQGLDSAVTSSGNRSRRLASFVAQASIRGGLAAGSCCKRQSVMQPQSRARRLRTHEVRPDDSKLPHYGRTVPSLRSRPPQSGTTVACREEGLNHLRWETPDRRGSSWQPSCSSFRLTSR